METVDGGMNEGMISSPTYPRLQCRNNKSMGNIDTVSAQSNRPRDRSRGGDEKLASVESLGMKAAWIIFCAIGVLLVYLGLPSIKSECHPEGFSMSLRGKVKRAEDNLPCEVDSVP